MFKGFLFCCGLGLTVIASAQSPAQEMSDLETRITLEQKRLALKQALAATTEFGSTAVVAAPLPQVLSIYGRAGKMRALLDMGVNGVRDVGVGDLLSSTSAIANIGVDEGVEVKSAKGKFAKGGLFLNMKAAPTASAVGGQGVAPGGVPAPGYPLLPPGLSVPPLAPVGGVAQNPGIRR